MERTQKTLVFFFEKVQKNDFMEDGRTVSITVTES